MIESGISGYKIVIECRTTLQVGTQAKYESVYSSFKIFVGNY